MPHNIEAAFNKEEKPKLFNKSNVQYKSVRLDMLKKNIRDVMVLDIVKSMPPGAHIAGGFWTNVLETGFINVSSDIDVFFTDKEAFAETYEIFSKMGYTGIPLNKILKKHLVVNLLPPNDRMPKVQLIKSFWFDVPEQIVDCFDFTICQFVSNLEELIYNPQGLVDLAQNTLNIHKSHNKKKLIRRVIKYSKKGFDLSEQAAEKINEILDGHLPTESATLLYDESFNEEPTPRTNLNLGTFRSLWNEAISNSGPINPPTPPTIEPSIYHPPPISPVTVQPIPVENVVITGTSTGDSTTAQWIRLENTLGGPSPAITVSPRTYESYQRLLDEMSTLSRENLSQPEADREVNPALDTTDIE